EIRRRVPFRRGGQARRRADRRAGRTRPQLQVHGGLRRPHAHDLQARRGGPPAAGDRTGARTGMPGVRHPDGPPGRRHRHRQAPGSHLHDLRRHDARAREPGVAARRQGQRSGRADGLLAARRAAHRAREPGPRGRLLRHRLRDDDPVDGRDPAARSGGGDHQLLALRQPRDDHPGDPLDPGLPRPAPQRLHRARPRLDGDRDASLRVHQPGLRPADRGLRIRAARHPAGRLHAHAPARRGALRGGEPVLARGSRGGQSPGAEGDRRDDGAANDVRVAGAGLHLPERAEASRRARGLGRGSALRHSRRARRRPQGLPVRRGPKGRHQALAVQGLRDLVHAGSAHRDVHGLQRGRLRGLLQLRASRRTAHARAGFRRV
ncbi:MAG: [NiFe] hydrogenase metallocenter assembly protein HypD, partial [uncultured Solirubrobacteraceae bacterium]